MKEVITKKMVEVEEHKFIAEDGKEFEKEYDCKMHEKMSKEKALNEEYNKIVLFKINIPYTDWVYDTFGIDVVKFKNKEDYYTAKAYHLHYSYGDVDFEEIKEFPCVKAIAYYEGYASFTSAPKQIFKELKEEVNRIDHELVINGIKEDM